MLSPRVANAAVLPFRLLQTRMCRDEQLVDCYLGMVRLTTLYVGLVEAMVASVDASSSAEDVLGQRELRECQAGGGWVGGVQANRW